MLGPPAPAFKAKPAKTLLTLPESASQKLPLSAWRLHSGKHNFGSQVTMIVNGETQKPYLTDFDKIVVAEVDKKWRIRVTPPAGKETEGDLDLINVSGQTTPWCLIGEASNDWLYVVTNLLNATGFTLEKAKDPR